MHAPPHPPEKDIDVASLAAVVSRSAVPLVIAAALIGMLVYGMLLLVPSEYRSETQVRIGGGLAPASPEAAALRVDREAIASRVQELRSPDLARKLAAEMRLETRPEFNSAIEAHSLLPSLLRMAGLAGPRPGETEEERVLAAYYRALQVYQVKDTRVITLAFTARDGELAARAANRLIELYQEWLRVQGATETADASAWLVPEIEKRTRELAGAEAAVERFRSSANLFRGSGGPSAELAEQQLTELSSEVTRARTQRSEAEARAQAARELIGRGAPDAIPDVQRSPVIQGLIAERVKAERELAEAATQLLPAHPRMKQLNANLADLRRQVQREAATIVDGLEREVKALSLRETLAQRAIDEAKSRIGNKAGDRVRLSQLEDEVKAKRRELDGLRERHEAARSRGTSRAVPVEVQVIATASPSSLPSWPNRLKISALTAVATLVLGLVVVIFRALLGRPQAPTGSTDRRRPAAARSARSAREPTREQPVSALPLESGARSAHLGEAHTAAVAPPAGNASVQDVVGRLLGNSAGQAGYRTLLVGPDQDPALPEVAMEIASGLAGTGRQVILVDVSRDGAGFAKGLGLAVAPGFNELMAGTASFDDVIRTLPGGNVHALTCGAASVMAAGDLDRLNLLLDALDEAYGDVIIAGAYDAVRDLFVAIEGRVDAAVVVGDSGVDPGVGSGAGARLFGFEVTEIDIVPLVIARPADRRRRREGTSAKRAALAAQPRAPAL